MKRVFAHRGETGLVVTGATTLRFRPRPTAVRNVHEDRAHARRAEENSA